MLDRYLRWRQRGAPARWLVLLAWLAIAFGPSPAVAAEVFGLYEAEAPVSSKDERERDEVLGRLLLAVATKVSGERELAGNPVLMQAAEEAAAYVQQFRYRSAPEGGAGAQGEGAGREGAQRAGTRSGDGAREGGELRLWARFDRQAIDGVLSEAGLPVWGRVRPSVLTWLAVERSEGRVLIGADEGSELADVLHVTAAQRGLPIILPLLDLEDHSRVRVSDVWGGFDDTVLAASRRYQARSVLVGRAYRLLPTLWEARWRLFVGDSTQSWSTQGTELELALEDGIHDAADTLAARFARRQSELGPASVDLSVEGVRTLEDYARTLSYLGSLDVVDDVDVTRVETDRVSFRLATRGGQDALEEVISLSRVLVPVQLAEGLAFRLRP